MSQGTVPEVQDSRIQRFRIHPCVQSHTRTNKSTGKHQQLFTPPFPSTHYLDPLAPAQERPRKCGVSRAHHDGVGDRRFSIRNRGSVRGNAGGYGVERKRAKGGGNRQHVAVYTWRRVVRARPEYNVAHTGAVSRRFRVRVSRYLPGASHGVFLFVSSHFPLFCLKKNRNASRPSEYPLVRGGNVQTFRCC